MSSNFDAERYPCPYPDYSERGYSPDDLPATGADATGVEKAIWERLYEIEDPEMPVSIVDMGLIFGVHVEDGHASVDMTLTYTGCPAREMLLADVEAAAAGVDGVEAASVELVWSPEWTIDMVTEQGKQDLRDFGLSV